MHHLSGDSKGSDRRIITGTLPAPGQQPTYDHRVSSTSEHGLIRGLQIPSRSKCVSFGFRFPLILTKVGITRVEWSAFTGDIERHASLSSSQWLKTAGGGFAMFAASGLFIGLFALVPASLVGHQMRKHREHQNMLRAYDCGSLDLCLNRWNESYFKPRGLAVSLGLPSASGDGMMEMDLSVSTKLPKRGDISVAPLAAKRAGVWMEEHREFAKACQKRSKALEKFRIVIMPLGQQIPVDEPNRPGGTQ